MKNKFIIGENDPEVVPRAVALIAKGGSVFVAVNGAKVALFAAETDYLEVFRVDPNVTGLSNDDDRLLKVVR